MWVIVLTEPLSGLKNVFSKNICWYKQRLLYLFFLTYFQPQDILAIYKAGYSSKFYVWTPIQLEKNLFATAILPREFFQESQHKFQGMNITMSGV